MNEVLDQILNKLLSERDRLNKAEASLSDANSLIFGVRNYFDSDSADTLLEDIAVYVQGAEATKKKLVALEGVCIGDVEKAIARAVIASGLTPTGNVKVDAENLARLLEGGRNPSASIL